jgi:hypothetical protein
VASSENYLCRHGLRHLTAVTLCEGAVDRTPGDAETLRDRRGPQLGPQLPDLRRVDLMGRPLYFPAADAARCPTSVST